MPTLESPPAEELERQSSELVTALNAAVMATMTSAATELGVNVVSSFAVTATVPSLWLTYIEKTALTYILDAYLDAAGFVLETVDANRQRGFSLISDTVTQQFIDSIRKQFVALGDELVQLVNTTLHAMIRATSSTDTVTQDTITRVIRTVSLPASRIAFVAQSMIRTAVESGTFAQVLSLGEHLQVTRTWKSHHDDRTRPWHRAADGQVVGLHDAFRVGDSWLQAPSVPAVGRNFDVGDVCNCRCTVRYGLDIITNTTNARSTQETSMAVPQPNESALVAAAGKWNPSAHPRGKDGRFIKKGALSTLLSTQKLNIGHVLEGVTALDKPQWDNLTDVQKTYIKDSVEKLPKASQAYKSSKAVLDTLDNLTTSNVPTPASVTPTVSPMKVIPAHKGAPPGTPAKVSTALVWGKYDDGDVILESAAGDKRVIWDGKAKKYATQEKLSDGTWQSTKFESKKDFYASNKGDNSYVVPGATTATSTVTTPTPEPVPTPTSMPTSSVVSVPNAPELPIPNAVPTVPEVSAPTQTALPTSNALLPNFSLASSPLSTALTAKIISDAPANSIIAQTYSLNGIAEYRIIKNADGVPRFQAYNSESGWKDAASGHSIDMLTYFLKSNKLWRLNDDLIPNVPKATGTDVTDWNAHLNQEFSPGSVVATSESGIYRIVQTDDGTYDIQSFKPSINAKNTSWDLVSGNVGLTKNYFTDDYFTKEYPGKWLSTTPTPTLTPNVTPAIPEVNVPTALHGENSEFTLSASVMGLPALTTMLSKIPPNTVIATYTPGIIDDDAKKRRIISTSTGLLERQVLTSSGQWDKVSTVGPTSLAAEFVSNAKWKINQDLVPNVQKPSGDPVTDWSAHLQKNFVSGDIIATHESGLKRVVQTGTTGYGTTYDVQTFDVDSNTWNVQQYEGMLNNKFFTSNAIHYSTSGEWIAGVPSTSPVAIPKPNIPTPVTPNIPGGVPLQYSNENVISYWTGLLGNKDHTAGKVVALHNSGNYRVVAQGVDIDYGNKPTYTIEKWNPDSNKWVKEYLHKFAPYDTYDKVADIPGPWLAPLPNGAQYPPKGSVPSTPNVPSAVSTPNVSAPVVSPSFNPLGTGSDITGIPASVKTAMKATLKPGKIGYWSKPEKIWDSIKEIQSKYPDPANPGHSQYSATQVLKALDSTLKTNDPSPFETKITKWAASPKGQAYIKKSLHITTPTTPTTSTTPPTVPTAPTPTVTPTSTPSMPSNISIGADDISHFTPDQKKNIFNAFKKQPNTFIGSPPLAIFNAAKAISKDHNISITQTLKIIDDHGALNAGVTNLNMFENKVKKWLTTKQGTLAAGGTALISSVLARKVDYSPGVSADNIPTFDASSAYAYEIMSVAQAHAFDKDVLKMSELPSTQLSALKSYSGNAYSDVNAYLYGSADTITPAKMNIAKNAQKAMRPSNIPMLLHRGVPYGGIADSTGFEDLQTKVGQTWMSGGFFSTSVGGQAAFSHYPVKLEVEVPPGTPMAWMEHLMGDGDYKKTLTSHPGEKEMLLAAGLSYRIISVNKDHFGNAIVRLRVVPSSENVTV